MDPASAVLIATALAVTSGFLDALTRNTIKASTVPAYFFNGFGFLYALPIYVVWLCWTGIPHVDPKFWLVIAGAVPLFIVAQMLTVKAHRTGAMAKTAPYVALTPVLLLLTGPLMGSGAISLVGGAGIAVMMTGIYVLNFKGGGSLLEPFRNLLRERASQLMIVVAAIFSVTANFDYLGLQYANVPFYLFMYHGCAAIGCLALGFFDRKRNPEVYVPGVVKSQTVQLVLFGTFFAFAVIPHMFAFSFTDKVAYVVAGKRTGMILFSVGIAIMLSTIPRLKKHFGGEALHLKYVIPGVLLIVVGMILVIFN